MSKLNLKSLNSRVNSHITIGITKKKIKMMLLFFIKGLFLMLLSSGLLLISSPFYGILLLIVFTKVYLFKNKTYNKYRNLFYIWGVFFFTWYFIFSACMFNYDESILIRPYFFMLDEPFAVHGNAISVFTDCEETSRIFLYVDNTYMLGNPYYKFYSYKLYIKLYKVKLGNFCMQTLLLLSFLSSQLGVTIYVPSIFKGILWCVTFGRERW